MRLNRLWLICTLAPLLGGCFTYAPTDLKFSSVRLEVWSSDKPVAPHVPTERFEVEFTSETDLVLFAADRWSSSIGADIFFCNRPTQKSLLGSPDVSVDGKDISYFQTWPPTPLKPPFTYQLSLGVSRREIGVSKPPLVSFDLRQKPEDVCFRVRGGNMAGFGYKSNIVTIPKAAIEAALAWPIRLLD